MSNNAIFPDYYLEQLFEHICVDKQTYNNLVKYGGIPSGLEKAFCGESVVSFANLKSDIAKQETVAEHLSKKKERIYLDLWGDIDVLDGGDNVYNNRPCMFIYDEYAVIIMIPNDRVGDPLKLNMHYGEASNVRPIAIPLPEIEKLEVVTKPKRLKHSTCDGVSGFYIHFTNGNKSYATFYEVNKKMSVGAPIDWRPNFTSITNQFICGTSDVTGVASKLEKLVNDSKKTMKEKEKIAELYGHDKTPKQLLYRSYSTDRELLSEIYEHKDIILQTYKDTEFVKLLYGFNEMKNEEDTVLSQLDISKKQIESLKRGVFSSFSSKKRTEIEKQKEAISILEQSLEKYSNYYASTMEELLKIGSPERGVSNVDDKEALLIYKTCISKNLIKIETEEELQLLSMICKSIQLPQKYANKEYYEYGRTLYNNMSASTSINKKKNKFDAEERYIQEKEKASIIGYEKYTLKLKETLAGIEANLQLNITANKLGDQASKTQAIKHDSYALGGLANAIAGPGLGAVTVIENEINNQKAEMQASETRASGMKMKYFSAMELDKLESQKRITNSKIKRIQDKICDVDNTSTYFAYLAFDTVSKSVMDNGCLQIKTEVKLNKEATFGGMQIAIDGSIHVLAYNGSICVGDSYINAPGFGEESMNKVGFNNPSVYDVILMPKSIDFEPSQEYTIKYEPMHIWMIEK